MNSKRDSEHFRGCLLGGAIGDALGWPVEFLKRDEIIRRFGKEGIVDLLLGKNGKAEITDDTQMTLFTIEGILRAKTRFALKGICHLPSVVYNAYRRWLITQGYTNLKDYDFINSGWLIKVKELHVKRAPGMSCLSALLNGKIGTTKEPINNSKGCGGVMHIAPVGLFYAKEYAFDIAVDIAALTHGHPTGYLSAGALAYLIALIIEGEELEKAANKTMNKLKEYDNCEECFNSLSKAIELTYSDVEDIDAISQLGEGWVAEEALGISVYCALRYKNDFKKAIITSVNHDGDSDSTGAITGNILGAYLGVNSIPKEWIEKVELKDVIIKIADDLFEANKENIDENWWECYPGY
ncbi:ADP-ribosylglycohydrolase family protein [Caloramator sp. CAR-1]|uniref:ADP-ribosylglycohydrolase family protein n=1 Tax=Caloramator sp. CAR-1 TaxID=3062777 RepID=UPI0026E2B0A8|nr:ADP-ribosylglycohydrolase family protein [Caloramator sp. CAR-1]MDO6354814.1 ADP-ribosylglycohydrolase family protein [Caloramator sp. CAR-1]